MATCSISTLLRDACTNRFACVDEKDYRGLVLQLLCNLGAAGGISFGTVAPTTSPSNTSVVSLYINTANGVLYYWNPTTQAWTLVTTGSGAQQIYTSAGNPNGVITALTTLPCVCLDTVNQIQWQKTDGLLTNTGWN